MKSYKFKAIAFLFAVLSALSARGQNVREVTGIVLDSLTQTPIHGVNITAKPGGQHINTSADGTFQITINIEDVLVFTSIGYIPLELKTSEDTLKVLLAQDFQSLNEVVVTGYGTQQRKDITGAITSVAAEDLKAVPAPNLGQALQGRAAGVTVVNDGRPGGNQTVRIRGFGTINNSNPLYVIDGVPTKQNLNSINPNDIETIQILKDAAAASVYGSRASNGVVVITTKQGRSGKPRLAVESFYGIQSAGKMPEMVTPIQAAEIEWALQRNSGLTPSHPQYGNGTNPVLPDYTWPAGAMDGDPRADPALYSYNPLMVTSQDNPITRANKMGTDWFDEIFQSAPIQSYQVTATGGTDLSKYVFSTGYFGQDGLLKYTGFNRYSIRANTEFGFLDNKLKIGENLQFAYTENRGVTGYQSQTNPLTMAFRLPRIIPAYDINGNFAGSRAAGLGNSYNPLAQLSRGQDNRAKESRVFGNMFAEINILEGLKARSNFGLDYAYNSGHSFDFVQVEASEPGLRNGLSEYAESTLNWTWTNTLSYSKTFNESHLLNVLGGTEAIQDNFRRISGGRENYFTLDPNYRYLSAGETNIVNSGTGAQWGLFSIFGKIDYSYKSKYLASATLRRDGSSRFGENNQYGFFPAVGLGWVISEEDMLRNSTFVNNLKLRGGVGKTGNQEIGNYAAFSTYTTAPGTTSYDLAGTSGSLINGFAIAALGNPDLRWETSISTNLGLDVAVMDNRLDMTIDIYRNVTKDMLYRTPLPSTAGGAAPPFQNIGEMVNKGIDIMLNYQGTIGGDLQYAVGGNFSLYRNEVLKIDDNDNTFIAGGDTRPGFFTRIQKGHPVSAFYTYQTDGFFQNQEEVEAHASQERKAVGAFRIKDINGDGIIDANDQTWIGNPHPDFTYGLNLSLNYKNIDLVLFFQGSQGNDVVNTLKWFTDFDNFGGNRSVRMLDTWTETNRDATLPLLNRNRTQLDSRASDYYIEDGSYLRLKNVQLGVNLQPKFLERIKIQNCRIYLQGFNLLTFTKYSGIDPELFNSGLVDMGIDQGAYPVTRSVNLGINLSL
ncbi:TonB-dependent receptor [Olivibacter sp. SDN3]|uniref:SusC/RagA family TonB-linked outer membrane protein n=1 Tax=Olivibacter sp. SDN3 TaxID=2764720 RepID=UPI0016514959|nr:TonB-dependent receptor [Olivibacter sp. SDN3]QNL49221.1 TonB-dependent receptor [Olivibacter sp. SDN3]